MTMSIKDGDDETVAAEYFVINNGWVELKDAEHGVVTAYPESRITRIRRNSEPAK